MTDDFYTSNWRIIRNNRAQNEFVLSELFKLKTLYRELNKYRIFSTVLENLLIEHLEQLIRKQNIEE